MLRRPRLLAWVTLPLSSSSRIVIEQGQSSFSSSASAIEDNQQHEMVTGIDAIVENVSMKSAKWKSVPIETKIQLLEQILANAIRHKDEWVLSQQASKGVLDPTSKSSHGYGLMSITVSGPATLGGHLNVILQALKHCHKNNGRPPKPAHTRTIGGDESGNKTKTIATIWPSSKYDIMENLEAFGMTGELVLDDDGNSSALQYSYDEAMSQHQNEEGNVTAVLAAGNFDAPIDLLCQLFIKGHVCVYKPNPINDTSVELLKRILDPILELGYVAFVPTSIESGTSLVQHPKVNEVVFTGSKSTLDKIESTLSTNDTKKEICSELGSVSPWFIVPGPEWNNKTVDDHARALAFAKMANNGHICVSPQVLVVPAKWKFRSLFWSRTKYWLSKHPGSAPFYPGAAQAHAWFGQHPNADLIDYNDGNAADKDQSISQENALVTEEAYPGQQRPILISNLSLQADEDLLKREAWCPVLMELPIEYSPFSPNGTYKIGFHGKDDEETSMARTNDEEDDPMGYLRHAIQTAQATVYGSLSATLLINDKTARQYQHEFDDIVVNHLPYGIVGINIWPIFAHNMAQLRWGACPGNSQSGTGTLANAHMFQNPEKAILRAPFSPYFLPRRSVQVMNPLRASLVFRRLTNYKLRPNLWTQGCLFAALFLGL